MKVLQNTYMSLGALFLALILSVALFVPLQAQASVHERIEGAVDHVVSELLLAHSLGEQELVVQLFTVLFELISLESYDIDNQGGSELILDNLDIRNIKEDEAEARVDIEWEDSDRAWIWFEYGEDRDELDYQTRHKRVDEDDDEHEDTLEDLDEDERYYVQAVAEDRDTGHMYYSSVENFRTDDEDSEDEPELDIEEADNIDTDSAEITGEVDMNDFRNGLVFFVWGADEDQVEDLDRDYDEYGDIDEDGDDLQVRQVDNDLDEDQEYTIDIDDLDDSTRYYFGICVEYEDEDDDETITCSDIENFYTGDQAPEVVFETIDNITDDSAELNGSVDMNDFRNGLVFFVWGEDENQVEDIVHDYDEYGDIDEDGDDLQKERVDADLDDKDDYSLDIDNLDDDTRHYASICVEYEDEDDDETITCSEVEDFRTDD